MTGILSGALAGAAGTTALNATTYLDMAVRGRGTSSTPQQLIEKSADLTGVTIPGKGDARHNRVEGLAPLAGTAVGVVVGAVAGFVHRQLAKRGRSLPAAVEIALIGGAAMAMSDVPLTLLGISDPGTWAAKDWAGDIVPHLVYAAVTYAGLQGVGMSVVPTAGLPAAALAGASTGSRSFTALAAVVDTIPAGAIGQPERALSHPAVKGLITLLAAQEWVLDKLSNTPSRLETLGICARIAGAAGAGALLARRAAATEAVPVPGEPGPAGPAAGPAGAPAGRTGTAAGPAGLDPVTDLRVPLTGAAVAAAAAAGTAWLGVRFRGACDSTFGRDWPAAAFEDAASLGLAVGAVRAG